MRSYQFQNLPSNWSEPQPVHIFVLSSVITAGFFANFTNPRLIQENTLTLSVEISVHWEHPESADDITGYEVYTGYEKLQPYDMYPSASAIERRSFPDIRVSIQVVEQQMVECND